MTTPTPAADQPPPDSRLVQQIVALLLVGAGVAVTIEALQKLLAPIGLGAKAVGLAARLALSVGPRSIDPTGLPGSPIKADRSQGKASENTLGNETLYRAMYLLNAARRLERSLHAGQSTRQAVRDERRYWNQHRDAQARRAEAARQIDVAALAYGEKLGWYAKDDERTSAECKAANGKNFIAGQRPSIGYPGTVHPHCRCRAGMPFAGAGMLPGSSRPPARTRKVA